MSVPLLVASVVVVLLGVAHSYLGERYILVRLLRRDDLPRLFGGVEFTKGTLRFAWHLTTVAWGGLAGVLAAQGWSPAAPWRVHGQVIAATFGLSGLVALVGSKGRHLSWVVFFFIAALVWLGLP